MYQDLALEKCTLEVWYMIQGFQEAKTIEMIEMLSETITKEFALHCKDFKMSLFPKC